MYTQLQSKRRKLLGSMVSIDSQLFNKTQKHIQQHCKRISLCDKMEFIPSIKETQNMRINKNKSP